MVCQGLLLVGPAAVVTAAEKTTQKLVRVPTEGFVWPNEPPKGCPFEQSKQLAQVYFTGAYHHRSYGDTWYPCWASDGNLYSPWTDGVTEGVTSISFNNGPDWKDATTGNAVMIGDDPKDLTIEKHLAGAEGEPEALSGPLSLRQPGLQRRVVLRHLLPGAGPVHQAQGLPVQLADSWADARLPHLDRLRQDLDPLAAFAGEAALPRAGETLRGGQNGHAHFVDFGKNMQYSPDGKAYLLGMGAGGK